MAAGGCERAASGRLFEESGRETASHVCWCMSAEAESAERVSEQRGWRRIAVCIMPGGQPKCVALHPPPLSHRLQCNLQYPLLPLSSPLFRILSPFPSFTNNLHCYLRYKGRCNAYICTQPPAGRARASGVGYKWPFPHCTLALSHSTALPVSSRTAASPLRCATGSAAHRPACVHAMYIAGRSAPSQLPRRAAPPAAASAVACAAAFEVVK